MYSLPYFKETDSTEVMRFIRDHPFITLCGCDAFGNPVATHIPVLIKEINGQLMLEGHVMKQTDHHLAFIQNPSALVIFSGPHTYVSASWYNEPRQASTWNYITVHARGQLRFLDEQALIRILKETTTKFENDPDSPASFDKLPAEYVDRLSNAIIAFEIKVEAMENVFKLSQNRDKESYQRIIDELGNQDEEAGKISYEMQRRAKQLFKK